MNIEEIVRQDLARYEIHNEIDVLNKLELYKVLDQDELTDRFIEFDEHYKGFLGEVVTPDNLELNFEEYHEQELKSILDSFIKIQVSQDVIIDCKNFPESLRLIYTIGSDEDKIGLANVLLGAYDTELVAVSEYTFNNLTGRKQDYIPIVLFNRIIAECINRGGSDVHFMTIHNDLKEPEYPIKFRIGNDLVPYNDFVLTHLLQKDVIFDAVSKKSNANARDVDTPYGVQTSINDVFGDGLIELRICCNRVQDGYHCVCRIQTKKTVSLKIDELGFTEEDEYVLHRVVNKRSGLTLITGAIRTGKNTTAYAIGNEMVNLPVKIVDYSSPIEVYMPFPQVDYNGDINILRNCMRAAKKQDINIAFLNEIPNQEVAFAVRDLVNSSIHVITTTHVDRLWHVFYKLKELFGDEYRDIISQINLVANQKMYKRVCKYCGVQYDVSHSRREHREFAEEHGIDHYYQGSGCVYCAEAPTLPVMELLYFTDDIKTNLLGCDTVQEMESYIKKLMLDRQLSLEYKVSDLIKSGELTISDLDSII